MKTSGKHPELHHYTSMAGLDAIVQSNALWARDFKVLNDSTEVTHIREKLFETLLPLVKRLVKRVSNDRSNKTAFKKVKRRFGSIQKLAEYETRKALGVIFDVTFGGRDATASFPPYITSFCSHCEAGDAYAAKHGLLSMWYGYSGAAEGSEGVSIVFDTVQLEDCMKRESELHQYSTLQLGDVVYANQSNRFVEEFPDFLELFNRSVMTLFEEPNGFDVTSTFIEALISTATRYKHEAFVDEREVRLVAYPWTKAHYECASDPASLPPPKEIIKDGSKERIVLFGSGIQRHLPIKRVIIGPHPDQQRIKSKVLGMLRDYKSVDVALSGTPFRPG